MIRDYKLKRCFKCKKQIIIHKPGKFARQLNRIICKPCMYKYLGVKLETLQVEN